MTWRERRVLQIAERVAQGDYDVPPIEVAHAILFGRPRWGDNPRMLDRDGIDGPGAIRTVAAIQVNVVGGR
jgi:hypothetical protein